jgi:hypothetical protein
MNNETREERKGEDMVIVCSFDVISKILFRRNDRVLFLSCLKFNPSSFLLVVFLFKDTNNLKKNIEKEE